MLGVLALVRVDVMVAVLLGFPVQTQLQQVTHSLHATRSTLRTFLEEGRHEAEDAAEELEPGAVREAFPNAVSAFVADISVRLGFEDEISHALGNFGHSALHDSGKNSRVIKSGELITRRPN